MKTIHRFGFALMVSMVLGGNDAEALLAVADQRTYREKQRGEAASGSDASGVLA